MCKEEKTKMDEALIQKAVKCTLYWDMCALLRNATKSQEEFNLVMQIARPRWLDKKGV